MKNKTKPNLISLFSLMIFLFIANSVLAQEILLRVKKGTVTHNNSKLTLSSPQFQLKSGDKITVSAEAVLVGTVGGSFVQVPAGKSYSFEDIKKMGKGSPVKASVGNEVFKGTMQKTSNNYGSSTRSGDAAPDSYSPTDTINALYVLDKKFKLQIGNKQTKLLTNIKLEHKNSGKTIFDAKPENKTVELSDLPEGEYTWLYKIEFEKDDKIKTQTLANVFIIPSAKEREQMLTDYNNVKKELDENLKKKLISKDLYDILLIEYKENKKIFITE